MRLKPGIPNRTESLDDQHWSILGQVYSPLAITEDCFTWRARMPADTFVPPHIHPGQDEYIQVLSGWLDLVVDGVEGRAKAGDLAALPRGVPHGLFNNSGRDVVCLFWVTPTGRLPDLFRKIHNVAQAGRVVAIAKEHGVEFLPPRRAAEVIGLRA